MGTSLSSTYIPSYVPPIFVGWTSIPLGCQASFTECPLFVWSFTYAALILFRYKKSKKKKKKARSNSKPPYMFRRRKLPYHLVLCCYARKGNRPKLIVGPSRWELLLVRREKRRSYCRKRTVRNMRRFYKALISMPSTGSFYLDRPDITLIEATISKLGPGGVPLILTEEFSLTSPDLIDINQDTLSQRALFVGRQYYTVDVGTESIPRPWYLTRVHLAASRLSVLILFATRKSSLMSRVLLEMEA